MFIPPPPLTREEFKKRYDAGARTMEELDPEFMAALRQSQAMRAKLAIFLIIGTIGPFIIVGLLWLIGVL